MNDMCAAKGEIRSFIKVIDEIAFQTNLLAFKSANEAAPDDRYGKGAAAIAEELRNLADRNTRIVSKTIELIEASSLKEPNRPRIEDLIANALEEIVVSVTQITDLVAVNTVASTERAQHMFPENQGSETDQNLQPPIVVAEDYLTTAKELSCQTEQLKEMLYRFQLATNQHPAFITIVPQPKLHEIGWNFRQEFYENELFYLNDSDYERF